MNKWLVVHDLKSFNINPRKIGFAARAKSSGTPKSSNRNQYLPAINLINDIKAGDKIVYYCKGDSVIKGIFEIINREDTKEIRWPDSPVQFNIKPIIELDDPYDFKLLVSSLHLFKGLSDEKKWGLYLWGMTNALKRLDEADYELIKSRLIEVSGQKGNKPERKLTSAERRKKINDEQDDVEYQQNVRESKPVHCPETPVRAQYTKKSGVDRVLQKNAGIARYCLEKVKYKCELNPEHNTFTSENYKAQYVEAHHLVPVKRQPDFGDHIGLDHKANIVSLCPNCHRLLHHSVLDEKRHAVENLYKRRADKLKKAGIKLSIMQLIKYY